MQYPAFHEALINPTCRVCQENEVTHCCKCTDFPTLFCGVCFPHHQSKKLRAQHQAMPIAAISPNSENSMRKSKVLARAITELQKKFERVEQYCAEFADWLQNCTNYLTEYRQRRKSWPWLLRQLVKKPLSVWIRGRAMECTGTGSVGFTCWRIAGF